ncbi:MAG: hypothetical protein Q9203_002394 [Teloschistes exilis]
MENAVSTLKEHDTATGQSRQSNKRINTGGEVDGASGFKHQRTTRTTRPTRSGKTMNYDMKYHPMDDILRPHQSAIRKAAHGITRQSYAETSESSTIIDGSSDSVITDRSESASIASPDPLTRPYRPTAPISGTPSSRRVTRDRNREKPISYNMKHHPMDDFLRPADARKRRAKWAQGLVEADELPTAVDSTPSVTTDLDTAEGMFSDVQEEDQIYASTVSPELQPNFPGSHTAPLVQSPAPAQSQLNRLATGNRETHLDAIPNITPWRSLKDDDRLLYLVQKGTPLDSNIMPVAWTDVATALDLKPDSFSDSVGVLQTIEQLQARYSHVYKTVQDYFGATPEPSENPTLRYAEGFDVYDCDVGDSYWAHSIDSVVCPTDVAEVAPVADHQVRQPCQRDVRRRFESVTIPGDAPLRLFTGKERFPENNDEGSDDRGHFQVHPDETEQMTIQDFQEANPAATERDTEDDHGLFGSYNSEAGYLRQVLGSFEETQMEASSELELVAGMRNELAGDSDNLFEPNELDHMLHSSSPPHSDGGVRVPNSQGKNSGKKKREELIVNDSESDETDSEDEDEGTPPPISHHRSPIINHTPTKHTRRQPASTRNSKTSTRKRSRQFSVHEDPPDTAPLIRRLVAKNPRSPGTDVPKENMRERSPSEEV